MEWRCQGTHLDGASPPGEERGLAFKAEEVRFALCKFEPEDLCLTFHELCRMGLKFAESKVWGTYLDPK